MRLTPAFLPILLLAACHGRGDAEGGAIIGAGGHGARDFAASGFDRVALIGPDDVVVKVGGAPTVHAEGDRAVVERLKIEVVDGELRVGRESGIDPRSVLGHATITVTLPALKGVALTGSGGMKVDRAESPAFAADITGSGDLTLAGLVTGKADFSVSGSGDVTVAGRADTAKFSITGSSGFDAAKLDVGALNVSMLGSGEVKAAARTTASVSLMGSGDVSIAGNPRCSVTRMGSGSVTCGGKTEDGDRDDG